jgi:two-component system OmpR family sensor kinase
MRLEAEGPVEVLGDRARLRQVFDNLLSNVRAHTPVGTSTVVRISERDQAVIEVIDDGPGIAADHAERLFERFFRADPSRSRDTGGAGLGLSIVAAIVAAHGGTVEAAPASGRGSVFIVRIPLSQPQG